MSKQHERILEYLEKHGSITCKEAMSELGVGRLPSRISELKKDGYRIITLTETGTNRFGDKCHYARYKVVKMDE